VKPIAVGIVLLAASSGAVAQPSAVSGRPDPADARVPVPPAEHQSPFARYRPFAAEVLGTWKAVNDEVGRIGGWKVYAREVYEEMKQAPPPPEGSGKPTGAPPESGAQRVR